MKKILSLLTVFALIASGILPTFAQYGGGRSSSIGTTPLLVRDTCPDGDFSGSLYDDECDANDDRLLDGGSIVDGFVFFDDNSNGSFDSNEDAIAGATVQLLERMSRDVLGTDITNSRGYYEFLNVQSGEYTLRIEIPEQVSFLEALFAMFVSTASAQTYAEVDVTVNSDGQIIQQDFAVDSDEDTTSDVNSVDDGSATVDTETDTDTDTAIDGSQSPTSILDGMGSLDVDAPMMNTNTDVMVTTPVVAPTRLPDTGASL